MSSVAGGIDVAPKAVPMSPCGGNRFEVAALPHERAWRAAEQIDLTRAVGVKDRTMVGFEPGTGAHASP